MSTEALQGKVTPEQAVLEQQQQEGVEFLKQHGAAHLGNLVVAVEHEGSVRTGTIAQALGGGCEKFRTFAESMVEIGGSGMLAPTITRHIEKTNEAAAAKKK